MTGSAQTLMRLMSTRPFALIDGVRWSEALASGEFDELSPQRLVPKSLEADQEKFPLLVSFAFVSEKMLQKWTYRLIKDDESDNEPVFSLIMEASPDEVDYDALINHLVKQLIQKDRVQNKRYMLRYYDPRVVANCLWILKARQLRYLFGPTTKWHYYHRHAWQEIAIHSPPAKVMIIDDRQWERLRRVGEINRVFASLSTDMQGNSFGATAQSIDMLLSKAAKEYHLSEPDDRVAFATHAMTVNLQFDQHPLINEVLDDIRVNPETTYIVEIHRITDEQWQAIHAWRPAYQSITNNY